MGCEVLPCNEQAGGYLDCYFCKYYSLRVCGKHYRYRFVCSNATCRGLMSILPEIDFEYLVHI